MNCKSTINKTVLLLVGLTCMNTTVFSKTTQTEKELPERRELSSYDITETVKKGGFKDAREVMLWYYYWDSLFTYQGTEFEKNIDILRDIILWRKEAFSLKDAAEWQDITIKLNCYNDYNIQTEIKECIKDGLTKEDAIQLVEAENDTTKQINSLTYKEKKKIRFRPITEWIKEGYRIKEITELISNKSWRNKILSLNNTTMYSDMRDVQEWKDAGFTITEIIGYSAVKWDLVIAKKLKDKKLPPMEAEIINRGLYESIYTVQSTPNYNLKKPYEYSFGIRPFYVLTENRDALENIVKTALRHNLGDLSLFVDLFMDNKIAISEENNSLDVYVIKKERVSCPWGDRDILQVKSKNTQMKFWTMENAIK